MAPSDQRRLHQRMPRPPSAPAVARIHSGLIRVQKHQCCRSHSNREAASQGRSFSNIRAGFGEPKSCFVRFLVKAHVPCVTKENWDHWHRHGWIANAKARKLG
jgi:hypothetical protein